MTELVTLKSKDRSLLLGFKFGAQANADNIEVLQEPAKEPDANGEFTMVLKDHGSELEDLYIWVDEDEAKAYEPDEEEKANA